ncbi:hypothetical protein THOG11_160118 [Vibrio harveyi]|nr:hypothetical protein TH15OA1_210027 [Vibrio harveyi]CAH1529264.1 hypothetical protein VHARVF571_220027 [Vibrio harveyi]CAH1552172.1 hypothetical protein THOD03_160117 [Vibrio harveyi]CAH1558230.1 hypothetical protein THOG11_160118 [Vibrio harveyi]
MTSSPTLGLGSTFVLISTQLATIAPNILSNSAYVVSLTLRGKRVTKGCIF